MEKQYLTIFGKKMAYYDEGDGETMIFIHGNPSSSY